MSKLYPSDISNEQFAIIEPILDSARKKTKPPKVNKLLIFNAILYIIKSGCQWRMLPKDYPKYQTVYYYFKIWSIPQKGQEISVLERVLKKIGHKMPQK